MKYNKLVRDRIPEIIENSKKVPITKKLNVVEFQTALNNKLLEEVNEYLDSGDIEELADILEVMDAIVALKDTTMDEVGMIKQVKKEERGGFDQRTFLIETL